MDKINLMENESEFMNSLEKILSSTERNLHGFIDDIPQIFAANDIKSEFHSEEVNGEKVHTFFDSFSTPSANTSKDDLKDTRTVELKCEELSVQVELLTKEKETAHKEIKRLKDQILSQSTYCASLGAVLGNLMWRASKFPQVVDIWLSTFQSKIEELLLIVNGNFSAFVNTYRIAFPPTSDIEYQFAIGLLGIVANISANSEGREFLITNSNGMEFVQKIIKLTPELPSCSLKRLILMILYNVSINKTGLQHLLDSRVGDILTHCLEDKSSSKEIQLLCLRVLQSVMYDLTEPKYIQDLAMSIPIARIESMASSKERDVNDAANQVIKYFQKCQKLTK